MWQQESESPSAYALDDIFGEDPGENHDYDDIFGDESSFSFANTHGVFGSDVLPHGHIMSAKIPPAWSGRGSWFAFEENVYDWLDLTILDEEKRGPALKSRLEVCIRVC